jgi:hypothetical protein
VLVEPDLHDQGFGATPVVPELGVNAHASLAWVPLTLAPCALTVMAVCNILFVDLLVFRFLGDVRREFMQRLYAALHGTLGSYLRNAFQEGSADAVACLPVPRA